MHEDDYPKGKVFYTNPWLQGIVLLLLGPFFVAIVVLILRRDRWGGDPDFLFFLTLLAVLMGGAFGYTLFMLATNRLTLSDAGLRYTVGTKVVDIPYDAIWKIEFYNVRYPAGEGSYKVTVPVVFYRTGSDESQWIMPHWMDLGNIFKELVRHVPAEVFSPNARPILEWTGMAPEMHQDDAAGGAPNLS